MEQEVLYEFLFKRTVQDLDQLTDLAPAGLRDQVKYARAALLQARPKTSFKPLLEKYPDDDPALNHLKDVYNRRAAENNKRWSDSPVDKCPGRGGHQEYIGAGLCPTCYPDQSESPRSGQNTSLEEKDSEKLAAIKQTAEEVRSRRQGSLGTLYNTGAPPEGAKTPRAKEVSEKLKWQYYPGPTYSADWPTPHTGTHPITEYTCDDNACWCRDTDMRRAFQAHLANIKETEILNSPTEQSRRCSSERKFLFNQQQCSLRDGHAGLHFYGADNAPSKPSAPLHDPVPGEGKAGSLSTDFSGTWITRNGAVAHVYEYLAATNN